MGPRCALCGQHIPLQGFGPLGSREFQLGDVKKTRRFFQCFWFAGRNKSSKVVSEDFFNIIPNISPTEALDSQHIPNIWPT